jgi:hypothetical protein
MIIESVVLPPRIAGYYCVSGGDTYIMISSDTNRDEVMERIKSALEYYNEGIIMI